MNYSLSWSSTGPLSCTIIFLNQTSHGPYFSKMETKSALQHLCETKEIGVEDAEKAFSEIEKREDFPEHTKEEQCDILMLNIQ